MTYTLGIAFVFLESGVLWEGIEVRPGTVLSNIPGVEPKVVHTDADPEGVAYDIVLFLKRKGYKNINISDAYLYDYTGASTIKAYSIDIILDSFVPAYAFKDEATELMNYLYEKYVIRKEQPPIPPSQPPEEIKTRISPELALAGILVGSLVIMYLLSRR